MTLKRSRNRNPRENENAPLLAGMIRYYRAVPPGTTSELDYFSAGQRRCIARHVLFGNLLDPFAADEGAQDVIKAWTLPLGYTHERGVDRQTLVPFVSLVLE